MELTLLIFQLFTHQRRCNNYNDHDCLHIFKFLPFFLMNNQDIGTDAVRDERADPLGDRAEFLFDGPSGEGPSEASGGKKDEAPV